MTIRHDFHPKVPIGNQYLSTFWASFDRLRLMYKKDVVMQILVLFRIFHTFFLICLWALYVFWSPTIIKEPEQCWMLFLLAFITTLNVAFIVNEIHTDIWNTISLIPLCNSLNKITSLTAMAFARAYFLNHKSEVMQKQTTRDVSLPYLPIFPVSRALAIAFT